MSLKIYTSNRMEKLLKALADTVAEPLASPFVPEEIVVQSKGMQRWLAMGLARHFGVWANCNYPFPNSIVSRLFSLVFSELSDSSSFTPEVMTWRIMGLLPGFLDRDDFAPLKHYLADDRDGLKRYQLSEKIADTFDQYTLFRPDMLQEWEAGRGDDWQSVLWRELAVTGVKKHRGRLKVDYCQGMDSVLPGMKGFPERISVFGISCLPKYHMDILAATARIADINLFLLSPTREYWGDIVSHKASVHFTPGKRALAIEGNPLLASLGRLGRDFSDTVLEIGDVAASQEDLYLEPGGTTLLEVIQSGILNLNGVGEETEQQPIDPDDMSVQIHSCHSPLREIEVLHDNLLAILDKGDSLEPRDIVVMTPDVETYAPYISTVFEGCQNPAGKIPYSIADRSLTSECRVASVVLKLLAIPGGRLPVTQVFDILESTPVSRRFDLDDAELEIIRGWLEETGVRWGMDDQDRARLGLPGFRENSWQAGLDRLLLGYAMPEEGGRLFNDILPFDGMEGSRALTLGKLIEFTVRIAAVAGKLLEPRTLGEWRNELRLMLDGFIKADDDSARELSTVNDIINNIGELGGEAGFTEKVQFTVIRSWLSARLAKEDKGSGFMTGGVTFCAMLPMRSIPFEVVALIGMNDGAFPRQSRPPGFDLIARNPCRGDRSLRDEDRYLFLESILSARKCLYISYVGQSIKDNSEIPPSVLVNEFLDAIDRSFTSAEGIKPEQRIVTRHRLQAFSRDYFTGGSALFSYSSENCAALLEKCNSRWQPAEFLAAPIAPPSDEWKDVPLQKLLRFFANPAKFFLENRMGIRLEEVAGPLGDREPFAVEGLESYGLKQELLEICLRGGNVQEFLPVARCRGILPPGRHGEALFVNAVKEVTDFARSLNGEIASRSTLEPLDFELDLGVFRLTGRLDNIWTDRMIRYRCAKIKANDQIRIWIEHLVLNAVRQDGYPCESQLMMVDGSKTYLRVEDASSILISILDLYWQGLAVPLRFFPTSGMEYAKKLEWNLERARQKWQQGYKFPGEGEDPYFKLCFGRVDPFNADFERVTRALLGPLMQHQV